MEIDFDAIVVGSGAGGAAFANVFVRAGKSVLMVDRGQLFDDESKSQDEQAILVDRLPYDDRQVAVNDVPQRLYIGGVLGGSTSVFGAAMLRPSDEDFIPGRSYGSRLPRDLWEWPTPYEEFEPHFDAAEALFRLSGSREDDYSPLHRPGPHVSDSILPLAPINERLLSTNRNSGLRPFRLPLAIDAKRCQKCDRCAGYVCPTGARRSAWQIVQEAAWLWPLHVLSRAEVERLLVAKNGQVSGALVRHRHDGATHVYKARIYVLAAGAIGSAAILLNSNLGGSHTGRNFMTHYSAVAVGIFPNVTLADQTFVKQIGFADHYLGTPDCPEKMGLIQSLPAPGPLMLAKNGLRYWPRFAMSAVRSRMLPLAGIVEDLPNPNNRVTVSPGGKLQLHHQYSTFDFARGASLTKQMCRILRRSGALVRLARVLPVREHVAHQCGTLRMGNHPDHAVVDAHCRLFGHDNVFVADGSVLPTSLGIGPSLTIAANAIRVAHHALDAC